MCILLSSMSFMTFVGSKPGSIGLSVFISLIMYSTSYLVGSSSTSLYVSCMYFVFDVHNISSFFLCLYVILVLSRSSQLFNFLCMGNFVLSCHFSLVPPRFSSSLIYWLLLQLIFEIWQNVINIFSVFIVIISTFPLCVVDTFEF